MMQHEFSLACWCEPFEEEVPCDDGDHTHRLTHHRGEDGAPLFFTEDDDTLPYCEDCSEALYHLAPDPDWLLAKGFISWRLLRNEPGSNARSFGVELNRPDDEVDDDDNNRHVQFNFGRRTLAIDLEYRSRKKPADVQAQQMAPKMIDEIERHLRDHT